MPAEIDELFEGFDAPSPASDSIEGERLHRVVRARLLDETIPETRIDRFVVIQRLGVGGMGVVFAAYDPQLDRKVAIKLVRRCGSAQLEGGEGRLIREARALAQLSHPNVVAIYDVGLHRDRVFIAMELVHGTTLRQYAADGTRPWQEILRCLVQAGEGLAAAHAADIVHRDFKPDNVLVGDDGRVRVLDFGLAEGDGALPSLSSSSAAVVSLSVSATGKVVGTPAYMAPEQFAGAPADARTDQFAFCVAFWEALFGERPYPATNAAQLRRMLAEGVIASPVRPERAPEWLRAAIARGLAASPDLRWPSMYALLAACTAKPRRRKRWVIAGAIVVGTGVAAVGGWALERSRRRAACERSANEIGATWGGDTAAGVVAAFAGSGIGHARTTAERIQTVLDGYAEDWTQTYARGCLAHVDHVLDAASWQRRQDCLDDRRERLATLLEVLQAPDRGVVNQAVGTAYELPPPAVCEDDPRLAANAAALGTVIDAEAVADLRRRIARAELLAETSRPHALALARAARDDATALGDPGLVAETELAFGAAQVQRGDYQAAADAYERAYFIAGPIGADEVALVASTRLVDLVGARLARFDDGIAWSRHADALLDRSGASRSWREADLEENVASVLRNRGDYAGARASYERAIALRTEFAGADHPAVGRTWASLGAMLVERRESDDAVPALDEAERILVAAYGRYALAVAAVYSSRGSVEFNRGNYEAAADYAQRAQAIRESLLEPDHPTIAAGLSNLATMRLVVDDRAGAKVLLGRAIEIRRKRLGSLDPLLATSLNNLGVVDIHSDDLPAALEHLGESLEIRRAVLPTNHPDTVSTIINLGDVRNAMHEPARALSLYEEAARMTEDGEGDIAREHGRALAGCGLALLELGESVKARDALERALATPIVDESDPATRCELRHGMARALLATDGDAAGVRELARTAHADCVAAGTRGAPLLDELAAMAGGDVGQVGGQ